MKRVSISGAKSVVVVGRSSNNQNKTFCWWGVNEDHNFEVGTISAPDISTAKKILLNNKSKGLVYNLKPIHQDKEFESLGVYTR